MANSTEPSRHVDHKPDQGIEKGDREELESEQIVEMKMEFGPFLQHHFASVSVDEWMKFSGIGPATIKSCARLGLTTTGSVAGPPAGIAGNRPKSAWKICESPSRNCSKRKRPTFWRMGAALCRRGSNDS